MTVPISSSDSHLHGTPLAAGNSLPPTHNKVQFAVPSNPIPHHSTQEQKAFSAKLHEDLAHEAELLKGNSQDSHLARHPGAAPLAALFHGSS
ncbi:hypothetical protein H4R34_001342 [Dimargaris verticillata]|uniref:Uncharacterized protein n=1 Tax=Dimargaris verticillata TaxID=2761393 RepID=A0A9W8B3S4_9FUNG|nr:hypothetical protein H4R34_001342 [Dimargaris verticillata]